MCDQPKCEGHVVKCANCKGTGKEGPYTKCSVCNGVGSVLLK